MSLAPPASFWEAAAAIAEGLHAPRTVPVLRLLAAWAYCEKPHAGAGAWQWNNPLNTTEPGFGSVSTANAAGVRIYPTAADGVAATVATLLNGRYPHLVQALRSSDPGAFLAQVGEMATWGTSLACIRADYAVMAQPPAQYLAASHPSAPGPTVSTAAITPVVTGGSAGPRWLLLAVGAAALGGAAVLAGPWLREQGARVRRGVRLHM